MTRPLRNMTCPYETLPWRNYGDMLPNMGDTGLKAKILNLVKQN